MERLTATDALNIRLIDDFGVVIHIVSESGLFRRALQSCQLLPRFNSDYVKFSHCARASRLPPLRERLA
jgi:hypothetical protein